MTASKLKSRTQHIGQMEKIITKILRLRSVFHLGHGNLTTSMAANPEIGLPRQDRAYQILMQSKLRKINHIPIKNLPQNLRCQWGAFYSFIVIASRIVFQNKNTIPMWTTIQTGLSINMYTRIHTYSPTCGITLDILSLSYIHAQKGFCQVEGQPPKKSPKFTPMPHFFRPEMKCLLRAQICCILWQSKTEGTRLKKGYLWKVF